MNKGHNDFFNKLMAASVHMSIASALADLQNDSKIRENVREAFRLTDKQYWRLECHEGIQTDVTDEDMLLLQIDMALDSGDEELFMQLTKALNGMEVSQ